MADQFDPTQFGAVAVDEPFDPTQHGAIPVDNAPQTAAAVAEPPKQSGGGFISGVGSALADAVKGLIPTSTEQVAELATPLVGSVKHVVETGQKLSHIAFGGKTFAEEFPQGKTYPEFSAADYGKLIGQVGVGAAQALLIHKGLTAPLAEQAGIAKPEVPPETPTAQPTEPVATDAVSQPSTIGETGLTQSEIAANREIVPQTEPPSATEVKESFPSLLQSSEDQRRTELQQEQPTPVRQALSLDELRLMRERNELNLQNDIAQRVTGSTHPAVDERLGQIDDELTKIANRELQTERGGEIRATKEGQIAESNIPEYQGNGQGGTPAEASGSGGVVERATEQGPREVGTVPQPEQTVPAPSAEVATTASDLPKEEIGAETAATDQPHVSSIANKFTQARTESGELGEIAPGQGYSTKELADAGLKMSPEQINQHVSDLMQDTGNPIEQGKAVRAEEARLSQRSNELSRAASEDPSSIEKRTAADNAFKDVTDFHNGPVAKLKQNWHAQGMGLQGELPVDLSTFNGLREAWLRDNGEAPSAAVEPRLRQMAENVTKSVAEDNGAKQELGQEIEKATERRKLPSYDEVRNNITDRMKVEPCRV